MTCLWLISQFSSTLLFLRLTVLKQFLVFCCKLNMWKKIKLQSSPRVFVKSRWKCYSLTLWWLGLWDNCMDKTQYQPHPSALCLQSMDMPKINNIVYTGIRIIFHEKDREKANMNSYIKGAWSYFSTFSFLFHLKNHHSKDVNFKFGLKRSSRLDVRSNFVIFSSLLYLTV